ncbi:unnamed protein product [Mortierella alpina]
MLHSKSPLYHEQQYRHQREFSEQSPPLSSSPSSSHHHSHRQSMNQYPSQSNGSMAPGSTQYRDHHSYEYPQQTRVQSHHPQPQQHQHHYPQQDHDHEHQHNHHQQQQGHPVHHQQQHQHHQHQHQHQQSYGGQAPYHSSQIQPQHHQHPVASLKQEDNPGSRTDLHSIPVIQSSDPSFTHRPHARSFSNSHPHSHPSQQPSHTAPQQHQHEQQHLPRLHHSVSAGHLSVAGHRPFSTGNSASSAFLGTKKGTAPGAPAPVKKKDPYATAWRTYSKIAEELNLLNPDGSLYPISKEAILKYLRHQSKRIKSSNLHWYVNGLKKHQENLGFSWDEVRYDDQVLALLKELTLHPVPIESNLASGTNNSIVHNNGGLDQTARPRQASGMTAAYPQTNSAPQRSISGSIDTSRIATLSISDPQHSKHNPQSSQQQLHQVASTGNSKRQPTSSQYEEAPFQSHIRQQSHSYSHRTQPYHSSTAKAASYHSAPVQLPSQHLQDENLLQEGSLQRSKTHSFNPAQAPDETSTSAGSSPMSSSELYIPQPSHVSISNASNVKRKRHEFVSERLARLASPVSPEDELYDEDDHRLRSIEQEDRGIHDVEDPEEDPSERIALKRHASTGTLRGHVRMSNMSAISSETHIYQRQGDFSHRDYPISTPSPAARENELNGGSHFRWESRLSPRIGFVGRLGLSGDPRCSWSRRFYSIQPTPPTSQWRGVLAHLCHGIDCCSDFSNVQRGAGCHGLYSPRAQ